VRSPGPDRSHPDRTGHFWTPPKTPSWGGPSPFEKDEKKWDNSLNSFFKLKTGLQNRSGHPPPKKTPLWGGLICWTSPKIPVWGGLICWTPQKTPVWGGLICGHQVDRDRGPGPYPVASPVHIRDGCLLIENPSHDSGGRNICRCTTE
jgi:hypothetical protein